MASGIDIAIDNLHTKLNDVRMELTEKRKTGFDTVIAELHLINIPSKIQMAEATKDLKDVQHATKLLDVVQKELNDSPKKDEVEYNEEKMRIRKEGANVIGQCRAIVKDAHGYLDGEQYDLALQGYLQLRQMYKYLHSDAKKEIYHEIIEIYHRINNKE